MTAAVAIVSEVAGAFEAPDVAAIAVLEAMRLAVVAAAAAAVGFAVAVLALASDASD